MTVQQIRAALLAAELGSITAAAKELNVSQPNVSNSIRLLEEEIGFSIFHRTSVGTVLSKKGEQFMEYGRQILEENDRIMALGRAGEVYRLRLGGVNYNTCIEPFVALCQAHRDDPRTDLRYQSVSVEEGISELARHRLDLVITPVLKYQLSGLASECKKNHIRMTHIGEIPAALIVRKGHPAALDGRCRGITQGSDAMKDFPYAAYRNLEEDAGSTGYNDSDFVQCSYKIYVDEIDVRLRLVGATNAFAFGARSSDSVLNRYGLVSFPVPGITLQTFALIRQAEQEQQEINDYLKLLREELRSVML